MAQHCKEVDVESLQDSGCPRRRGGCLNASIILVILVLFVAVTALAVGGVMVVRELRAELKTSRQNGQLGAFRAPGDAPPQTYKMQNFVFLQAKSSQLKLNSTMLLASVRYGEGTSVGSNFIFDSEEHSLSPVREGTYFIYIDLHLTCTYNCSAGVLSVQVGDKLTCEAKLPSNTRTVKHRCWNVTRVAKEKLLTQIFVPKGGLPDWKLELEGSGLGMFLVD